MRVLELWRYPVSSIGGERLASAAVGEQGIKGDRMFVVVDGETFQPAMPEKMPRWRKLLFLSASWENLALPEIRFPNGSSIRVEDKSLNDALSDFVGFPAVICKYEKPALEALAMPVAKSRYQPAPLHVVTQSSMDRLSDSIGAPVEVQRFRPNILLDGQDISDFEENAWIGQSLRIGQAIYPVTESTARCGMTIVAQPGTTENAEVLRTILRLNRRNFGAYCQVREKGVIAVGDHAEIEKA